MKVAIGFYGFIRTKITREHVLNFINFFPPDTVFDLYVNCPNKLGEFDEEPFNIIEMKKELYEIFNFPNINIGKINLYHYDPFIFINKSEILKLPYCIEVNNLFGCFFRTISLHNGISNICKLILHQNIEYDMVVCTRFDILPNINSIGDCIEKINKKNIFILDQTYEFAYDIIFYSSMYGIYILSNMYEYIYDEFKICITQSNLCSEWIITDYLNKFSLLEKKHFNGMKINTDNLVKSTISRTQPEFKKNMIDLLKEYNKLYNRNYFGDEI